MNLIDKDALVAEINRQKDGCYKICVGDFDFLKRSYPQRYYSIETYDKILSFLETLEVKEVDLENKVCKWLDDNCDDSGYFNQLEFAKHFFELGLKAQKGE